MSATERTYQSRGFGPFDVVVHVRDAEGVIEGSTNTGNQLAKKEDDLGSDISLGRVAARGSLILADNPTVVLLCKEFKCTVKLTI